MCSLQWKYKITFNTIIRVSSVMTCWVLTKQLASYMTKYHRNSKLILIFVALNWFSISHRHCLDETKFILKQIEFLHFEQIWGLLLTIQNHVFSQQIAQNCWKLSKIAKAYKMLKNHNNPANSFLYLGPKLVIFGFLCLSVL